MTLQQRYFIAKIVALVLVLFGVPGAIIAWSASHRPHMTEVTPQVAEPSTRLLDSASSSPLPSLSSFGAPSSDIVVAQEQVDFASAAVAASVKWSEAEPLSARTDRLSEFLTDESAAAVPFWHVQYGTIEGAAVEVYHLDVPQPTYQSTEATVFVVRVTYKLYLPGQDDSLGQALWTVSVPNELDTESRAIVQEPNGA